MAGPRTVEEVDRLISYTGVRATTAQANSLIARGLAQGEETEEDRILHLTTAGRNAMVRLVAAARAIEAEAMLSLGMKDLQLLKSWLAKLSQSFGTNVPVSQHMNVLAQQLYTMDDIAPQTTPPSR
jgi:DNA-binding MarR family transcriptional regulator